MARLCGLPETCRIDRPQAGSAQPRIPSTESGVRRWGECTPRTQPVRGVVFGLHGRFRRYTALMQKPAPLTLGSVTLTRGFRVSVSPRFEQEHSDATEPRYVFSYRIRIRNESAIRARLVSRRWLISDATGKSHEVRGEGVVGRQPELDPGESYEYGSFCPLPTPWGTMEGSYIMQECKGDGNFGEPFEIEIGRFYLLSPD
jgi:ApaG protein